VAHNNLQVLVDNNWEVDNHDFDGERNLIEIRLP
jgi:hypothetical protein